MTNGAAQTTECCPKFDPKPWDGKVLQWKNRKFVKDKVFTLFYVPVNFGPVITRLNKAVEESGGQIKDWMCLSDHTSMWNMDLYLAVDKEIEGLNNVEISGTFLSKVYEGDFKNTAAWGKDFKEYASSEGFDIKKIYMWYTTCPGCAKKYGKNYVVMFASVDKSLSE
ncbi:MAG: hydrolase [Patescibacteria group bacterium]